MDIITKIKDFINIEAEARVLKQKELLKQSLKTRIAKGEALIDLEEIKLQRVFKGKVRDYDYKVLAWDTNNSKFKVGDYVKIHKGDFNDEDNLYEGIINFEGFNYFVIGRSTTGKPFKNEIGATWIMDRDSPDLRHFFIEAMNSLMYLKRKKEIIDIIKGNTNPEYSRNEIKKAILLSKGISFNRMQKKAFIRAYATKNFALIQGPPGTGKTWLLAHIALKLAESGQKVLITSLTHKAINNALLKVREISDYQNIIKVGQAFHQENLLDNNIKCLESFDRKGQLEVEMSGEKGLIIGGTTYALFTRMKAMMFDTILFDEASQLTIAHSVATMMKGEKYIFIGDHKQMPPIFNAHHSDELLSKSLFENLMKLSRNSTMLNITYRMNNELSSFVSETFYNGILVSDKSIRNKCFELKEEITGEVYNVINPNKSNVVLKIQHQGNKMESIEEANVIIYLVVLLIKVGVAAKDIGIIVPYRAQARLIKKQMHIDNPANTLSKSLSEVVVDTVERMQGQEKDIVFISMAASDRTFIDENAEFLFNPNRFNVSISRAKFKQFLVCSSNLLNAKSEKYQHHIDNFNKLDEQSYSLEMRKNT